MRFFLSGKLGWGLLTAMALVLCATGSSNAGAAVAVTANGQTFAYCAEKETADEAEKCALEKCGAGCKLLVKCDNPGFGAVHQNFINNPGDAPTNRGNTAGDEPASTLKSVTGASCGMPSPGEASQKSGGDCKRTNRALNSNAYMNFCFEKSIWYDPERKKDEAKEKADVWCPYAAQLSGMATLQECLESQRYENPEQDCIARAKQWCRN